MGGERGGEGAVPGTHVGLGEGAERVRGGPSPPPPELALGCGHIPPVYIRATHALVTLTRLVRFTRAPRMASELNVRVPRCS